MIGCRVEAFEQPDEVREFANGKVEVVRLGALTVGRGIYEPGWKWSEYVGPQSGSSGCTVVHIGLVVSGTATAVFDDGHVVELCAGDLFHIPPEPHDSWVVGDQRYVSVHFLGADRYGTWPFG